MQIESHSFILKDFSTSWYKRWAKELKQDKDHLDNHSLKANKFWQNSVIVQALWERGAINKSSCGLGFGVGQERLPALFAKYGVNLTATDQDFKKSKAKHWSEYELATGSQSLNKLGICDNKLFSKQVEYMPLDMTKIPKTLYEKYDFLWSNCALGHLGSIKAGLNFIVESLNCLKPGGIAVHTTELNILSMRSTADNNNNVVVFRLIDIFRLQKKLVNDGFRVSLFKLDLGDTPEDKRICMSPKFGNDYSKIQILGNLATQIVLIIQKPKETTSNKEKTLTKIKNYKNFLANILKIQSYKQTDKTIKTILKSQNAPLTHINIKPKSNSGQKITLKKGQTKTIFLEYINDSKVPLFGLYGRLSKNQPIVLGTSNPSDHDSLFFDKTWPGKNRLTTDLWLKTNNRAFQLADHIQPKQDFALKINLNSNNLKLGNYTENFTLVQEPKGWIKDSEVKLDIKVAY